MQISLSPIENKLVYGTDDGACLTLSDDLNLGWTVV